jgi:flagellin
MANRVEFNKKKLINGSFAGGSAADRTDYIAAATTLNDARQALIGFVGENGSGSWTELVADARSVAAKLEANGTVPTAVKDLEKVLSQFDEAISHALSASEPGTLSRDSNATVTSEIHHALVAARTLLGAWDTADSTTAGSLKTAAEALIGTPVSPTAGAVASPTTLAGNVHNLCVAVEDYSIKKTIVEKSTQPGLYFQVGANADQSLEMSIGSVKTDMLGIGDGYGNSLIDVMKTGGKQITFQLDVLDEALTYVTTQRSKLGAAQNRLEYTINSLDISTENLTAAESRVRDVDMAKEMTNFTRQNILFQASTAMLAQANAFPQGVLQLLG